jgi:uncharacterized protein YyaL (SSP411 family)
MDRSRRGQFRGAKKALFETRERRVRPGRDDKVLVDWNGLMIASLANAGAVFGEPDWIDAARGASSFICEKLGDGDRLFHSYRAGKGQHPAFADGYAAMARAALALWEATRDRQYLERAIAWTRTLDRILGRRAGRLCLFRKSRRAGTGAHAHAFDTQTPVRQRHDDRRAWPAVLRHVDQSYAERANTLIQAFAGDVGSQYMQMATYLNNFEFCTSCLEIIVIGPPDDSRPEIWSRPCMGRSLPNRLLMVVGPGESLPPGHPAEGKMMQEGSPPPMSAAAWSARRRSPARRSSHVLQLPENSPMAKTAGNA